MDVINTTGLDQLALLREFVYTIPIFPYLWIPHCILMSMAVRATVGGIKFSRTHPLACYMMATVYTFPGGILASLLLAEPPLAFLANTPAMVVMTIAWYLVFYSPYDFFVKMIESLHMRHLLGFLQDIQRIQLVISGVETIHAVYPKTLFYPFVFATAKSSGFMFIKYIEAMVFNSKPPKGFVVPNHHSKTCMLAAVLFIASDIGYLEVEKKTLFFICCLITLTLRLASMLPSMNAEPDPYLIFENVTCYVLFGHDDQVEKPYPSHGKNVTENGKHPEDEQSRRKQPESKGKTKGNKVSRIFNIHFKCYSFIQSSKMALQFKY